MSWDNVEGVSSVQIWTDNPDMTQAYLFANGNHQVKLTIGVSLSLSGEGPTYEEVKTALSLIDFETGAGISHLKTGDKGEYAYVYQPNEVSSVKVLDTDASGTGAYQYEVDYYLSSDSTINENYASEKVALLLTYIDGNGNKIDYQTASGSKSQSYVAVTVSPPKKYGMDGTETTQLIIPLKDDKPHYTIPTEDQSIDGIESSSGNIYSLRIDDGYYRIIAAQIPSPPNAHGPFYNKSQLTGENSLEYFITLNNFFLPNCTLNKGTQKYNIEVDAIKDSSTDTLLAVNFDGYQEPNELILIHFSSDIIVDNDKITNNEGSVSLTIFDQFGNEINATVGVSSNKLILKSVN